MAASLIFTFYKTLIYFSYFFFPRKQDLALHANCLLRLAWNVKSGWHFMQILRGDNLHELSNSIFSEKIRQKNSKCRQLKFNSASITKTRLYHFDPLKPHFYIVILGFTGVYIMFLISAKNIDCGYSLEPPLRGDSYKYPQSMFWAEIWRNIRVFHWKFYVFGGEIFFIFESACFHNGMLSVKF